MAGLYLYPLYRQSGQIMLRIFQYRVVNQNSKLKQIHIYNLQMSTLSKTPDDKMHRYLQRIQKLVGHRGKSPTLIKSRTKSPLNIKTSRIDNFLKQEIFFKSVINVWDEHHRKIKAQFLGNLIGMSEVKLTKRRDSQYSSQTDRKTIKKENDQPLAVRFMVKALQNSLNRQLKFHFQLMRQYQFFEPAKHIDHAQRDIKRVKSHRRTYSQIYAQSVSKYQSKYPSTSGHYDYKTSEPVKFQTKKNAKMLETRFLLSLMTKFQLKFIQNAFSDLKSFNCTRLTLEINHKKITLVQSQKCIGSLKKQYQKSVQQLILANDKFKYQDQAHEHKLASLSKSKQQEKSRHNQYFKIIQVERILLQTNGIYAIYQIINQRNLCNLMLSLKRIELKRYFQQTLTAKLKALQLIFRALVGSRKIQFLNKLRQKSQKNMIESQSRIVQRTQKVSQPKIQSMVSSKHSFSSQKSVASNFDLFAQTINKAFELRHSLREIYSYGFQKIDEAAFLYMSLSVPISKILKTVKTQSFRKILFYSFYKSQQQQLTQIPNELTSLISSHSQFKNNYQKMWLILKKVQNKILVTKIQGYSVIKLHSELKKQPRMDEKKLIPQKEIRMQIKQFLQQRNKMHQKTCDAWQKTKQMLQETASHNSSKGPYSSRVKA